MLVAYGTITDPTALTRHSFLVFLPSDGPAQLATGALITFLFLLLNLICRPFCTPGLNTLQSFSLISQFLTLFCGILIGFREAMQTMEASKGTDSAEREEARLFGYIIVLINCGTLAFPLVRKIMTGKHIEFMERIIFVLKLPSYCYMSWCGGGKRLDARIAKKRQERAARYRAQSGHTELPAAPAVRDEPAFSSLLPEQARLQYGSDWPRQLFGNEQDAAVNTSSPDDFVHTPLVSNRPAGSEVTAKLALSAVCDPVSPKMVTLDPVPVPVSHNLEPSVEPPARLSQLVRADLLVSPRQHPPYGSPIQYRNVESTGYPVRVLIVDVD